MANRNRRSIRPVRQNTGRKPRKKEKVNLVPVAAALVVLILLVAGFSGLLRTPQPNTEEETTPMIGNQPEFFSTIRPETMNDAEVDLVDDPTKAADYFENSLFIGDAQMDQLKTLRLSNEILSGYLEKALFLTASGYSWESMKNEFSDGALTFNLYGEYVSLTGAIEKVGAEKVVILLGRIDLLMELPDTAAEIAQAALLSLKQACPNTEIIVLTMTPNMADTDTMPSNKAIAAFNASLRQFCAADKALTLVDVAALFPEDGLPAQYCADPENTGRVLNAEGGIVLMTGLLDALTDPQIPAAVPTAAPTAAPTQAPAGGEDPVTDAAETVPQPSGGGNTQAAGRGSITG